MIQTKQLQWKEAEGWETVASKVVSENFNPQVLLVFGERGLLESSGWLQQLQREYNGAHIVSCSSSGEIYQTTFAENSIVATAIEFEKTSLRVYEIEFGASGSTTSIMQDLSNRIEKESLKHVLLFCDGAYTNGSALVDVVNNYFPEGVTVTGGMAGDNERFNKTIVGLDAIPQEGRIVAVALYGEALQVGFSSSEGWEPFGPEREITKSFENVLYELDGVNALDLYKNYLGEEAKNLPKSALHFPLRVIDPQTNHSVVRTILSIQDADGSMKFAGDIPQGGRARLARANYDRLLEHVFDSSLVAKNQLHTPNVELAICVSCVGRKVTLGPRTVEEIENVREIIGDDATIAGFYSYGEIAPREGGTDCLFHNETLTLTLFSEK